MEDKGNNSNREEINIDKKQRIRTLYKKYEKTKKKCLHSKFKSDNIITSRRGVEKTSKKKMKKSKKDVDAKNWL